MLGLSPQKSSLVRDETRNRLYNSLGRKEADYSSQHSLEVGVISSNWEGKGKPKSLKIPLAAVDIGGAVQVEEVC